MPTRSSTEIWQYWQRIRGLNAAPMRRDVDPGAIRAILPDVFILEHGADGATRFRLAGTRICAAFGRELRGTRLADLWTASARDAIQQELAAVMLREEPAAAEVTGRTGSGQAVNVEVTVLPMRSSGPGSDRILGTLCVHPAGQWLGNDPLASLAGSLIQGRPTAIAASCEPENAQASSVVVGVSSTAQGTRRARPLLLKILDGGRRPT